jgi:hypothetical protein
MQGRGESYTKFGADSTLSSRSRQAMVDAGLTDAASISKAWSEMQSKYGTKGAKMEWGAKYDFVPELDNAD